MTGDDGRLPRDEALARAIEAFGGNPVQFEMLRSAEAQPIAASHFATDRKRISRAAYHMGQLRDRGFIRQSRQEQRRGATITFYAITAKGRKLLRELGVNARS